MPRSTRTSTSRPSAASRRNTKRGASKQSNVYEIPESPDSSTTSKDEEAVESLRDTRSMRSTTSPTTSTRGRSMSTSSTAVTTDCDATPTQARPTGIKSEFLLASKQAAIPGFEALEAVNSLYQKLKDSQAEIDQLHRENENFVADLQKEKKLVDNLQAELRTEREKTSRIQKAYENENENLQARQDAEADLKTALDSLRGFSSAAFNMMPLLDVLTGAPDIEYDDKTEKLYRIFKKHKVEKPSNDGP